MKKNFTIIFLFMVLCVKSQFTLSVGNTVVQADTVCKGLDAPWEIIYGSDNHLWFTERKGLVSRLDPTTKVRTVILDIVNSVYASAESGMLGMAIHPDYPTKNEIFLVYTYGTASQILERLVKYQFIGNALVNPQVIIDSIPAKNAHDGSRLMFMPDKTLLMTTGDAHIGSAPQSTAAINGKVLRLNADGTIPADNPFPGSYTYSFGHRNTQGLAQGPDGRFYISEHGTATDDEFQLLEKGRNYGWPDVQGFCDEPAEITFCNNNNVKVPIIGWTPSIAPSDLVYYENNSFPELNERFLMTTLKSKRLVAIKLDWSGAVAADEKNYLANSFGRLRDICLGPKKEIFLATNGADAANIDPFTHTIMRLTPPSPTVSISREDSFPFEIRLTNKQLVIDNKGIETGELSVSDLQGKIMLQAELTVTENKWPLDNFSTGVYVLKIKTANGSQHHRKIIVTD